MRSCKPSTEAISVGRLGAGLLSALNLEAMNALMTASAITIERVFRGYMGRIAASVLAWRWPNLLV